jgi:hypothetical protein
VSLGTYCDAVWSILIDAPFERLEKFQDSLVVQEAIADPERARETWGLLPEHQRGAARAQDAQPPPDLHQSPSPGIERGGLGTRR